jgi:hypothetical protein
LSLDVRRRVSPAAGGWAMTQVDFVHSLSPKYLAQIDIGKDSMRGHGSQALLARDDRVAMGVNRETEQ